MEVKKFDRNDKDIELTMQLTVKQYTLIQIALHDLAKKNLKVQKDYELMAYTSKRPIIHPAKFPTKTPSTKPYERMMEMAKQEFESVQQIIEAMDSALK